MWYSRDSSEMMGLARSTCCCLRSLSVAHTMGKTRTQTSAAIAWSACATSISARTRSRTCHPPAYTPPFPEPLLSAMRSCLHVRALGGHHVKLSQH